MRITELLVSFLSVTLFQSVHATIGCYECTSRNGSDPNCDDPLNPALSVYKNPCLVPKEGHIGEFPANFCLKVIGKEYWTRETLIIRKCALESMESMCGEFQLEEKRLYGCILTCDYDGCNAASSRQVNSLIFVLVIFNIVRLL